MMSFHYSKKSSTYLSYSFQNQPSINTMYQNKKTNFTAKTMFVVNTCYLYLDGVSDIIGIHLLNVYLSFYFSAADNVSDK